MEQTEYNKIPAFFYENLGNSMLQLRDSIESQSVLNKLFKTQDLQWFLQKKFTKEKHLKMSI